MFGVEYDIQAILDTNRWEVGRDMTEPNTLFILAKWGLKVVEGVFETHMWILTEQEASMKYVSLHKSKADRASKGGEIVNIRLATEDEIQAHQALLTKEGHGPMKSVVGRKIIEFKLNPKLNPNWPNDAKTNPMAYKGLGYLECCTTVPVLNS